MKNEAVKAASVFLAGLIIAMPFYSASALALLSNGRFTGGDGIVGYSKRQDTAYLNVTAQIRGDTNITRSQVYYPDLSGAEFDECHDSGDGIRFHCIHQMQTSEILENPFKLTATLYYDTIPPIKEDDIIIYGAFDQLPPEIKELKISPQHNRGVNATISYKAYDHSYSTGDSNRCTGIKHVEFSSPQKGVFWNKTFDTAPNNCEVSGSFSIELDKVAQSQGQIDITIAAYDHFSQIGTGLGRFNYDTQAPTISTTLEIKDLEGNEIDWSNGGKIIGSVIFTVLADDLDVNSAYGNISQVSIYPPSSYTRRQASCSRSGSEYRCSFVRVELWITETRTISIDVNVSDMAGNSVRGMPSKTITFDSSSPTLAGITTNLYDDASGTSYVGAEPVNFTAEINEAGAGVDKEDIKLDLSRVKTGLISKQADLCEFTTAWRCHWYNILSDKPSSNLTVSLLGSSTDRLGNPFAGELSRNIIIDKTAPVVVSSVVEGIGMGAEGIEGIIKTTDAVKITSDLKDRGKLRGIADVSRLVTTQNNITGSCTKSSEDDWECVFESSPIDVPGYIETNIPIYFFDFAGNKITHQQPIIVHNYSDDTNPSYWAHTITCAPSLVDRQITPLIEYRVMCSISLMPLSADQETISMSLEQCTDIVNGSTAYIGAIELINAERGSTNPYLNIKLSQTDIRANSISMNCPISIITKAGGVVTQYPETENATVEIGLYNMPLGEYDENIIEQIMDVENEIAVGWEWMDILNKIVFYATKICETLAWLSKLQTFWGFMESLPSIGKGVSTVSFGVEHQTWLSGLTGLWVCKIFTCDYTLWGNWYTGQKDLLNKDLATDSERKPFYVGGDKEVGSGFASESFITKYDLGSMYPPTPKDSLIFSIFTGCIPGVIHNIDKWRQIQCNYGVCLFDSAQYANDDQRRIPINVCKDQQSYMECQFVFGQINQLLPFYWWRSMWDNIKAVISDPFALIFSVIDLWLCPHKPGPVHGGCAMLRGIMLVIEIIGDLDQMFESASWELQGDMCEVYFERLDEFEEEGSSETGGEEGLEVE